MLLMGTSTIMVIVLLFLISIFFFDKWFSTIIIVNLYKLIVIAFIIGLLVVFVYSINIEYNTHLEPNQCKVNIRNLPRGYTLHKYIINEDQLTILPNGVCIKTNDGRELHYLNQYGITIEKYSKE